MKFKLSDFHHKIMQNYTNVRRNLYLLVNIFSLFNKGIYTENVKAYGE